jgi:UDP-3-O-[3-hydroxymyristoyl] glucosamine N-acyltransferase
VSQIFQPSGLALAELVEEAGVSLPTSADPTTRLQSGASLETAQSWHIAYIDHARYANALRTTKAGACFVSERFAHIVPPGTIPIIVRDPRLVYARVLARLHPEVLRAAPLLGSANVTEGCFVHPSAQIGAGVVLDPGVVIGERVFIGAGTTIGAHVVLGPDVVIGWDCSIGPSVTITHCNMGDRSIVHAGVRIGQDGFGFAMSASGHVKCRSSAGSQSATTWRLGPTARSIAAAWATPSLKTERRSIISFRLRTTCGSGAIAS